ncbi:MAG TPA: Mrp/NBP35 family ATP-binding protein [Methanomassiliicoccales archaeon]|nr:Mrp/NBP35 family ATP-binding protein [Methanomassiliicoccales archaeon]HPR98597.1 Mrp/NBP35 family ATP-binding protein [Methanomassiliicoccales archaeon]
MDDSDKIEVTTMDEKDYRLKKSLAKIKHKIVVMSGKGGVGKSTVTVNLATALAMRGYEVGILDADIHGPNIPKMLNIEHEDVISDEDGLLPVLVPPHMKVMSMAFLLQDPDTPVVWRGPIKMGALRQFVAEVKWGDLDFLIVDLPPGTGDEPLTIAQLLEDADGAIIVTTPQDVALLDSRKSVTFAQALKMPIIGIVENMSGLICPHCHNTIDLFKTGGGERAAEQMGVPFLGRIPLDPNVVLGGDDGSPIVLQDKSNPASKAFDEMTEKVLAKVNGGK